MRNASPKCVNIQRLSEASDFLTFLSHQLGSMDRYLSTHKNSLTWKDNKECKAKTISMSFKQNIWVVNNLQSEPSAWGHGIKFNQVGERSKEFLHPRISLTFDVSAEAPC